MNKISVNGESININEKIYSTKETHIGTWIDGKPLYRRFINGTTPTTTAGGANISIDDLGIDELVFLYGFVDGDKKSREWFNTFTIASNNTTVIVSAWQYNRLIQIATTHSNYQGKPYTLILEYTKI